MTQKAKAHLITAGIILALFLLIFIAGVYPDVFLGLVVIFVLALMYACILDTVLWKIRK